MISIEEAHRLYIERTRFSNNKQEILLNLLNVLFSFGKFQSKSKWANITAFPLAYPTFEDGETHIGYIIWSSHPIKDHEYWKYNNEMWVSAPKMEQNEVETYLGHAVKFLEPVQGTYLTFRVPTEFEGPSFSVALWACLLGMPFMMYTGDVKTTYQSLVSRDLSAVQIAPVGEIPLKLEFCKTQELSIVIPLHNYVQNKIDIDKRFQVFALESDTYDLEPYTEKKSAVLCASNIFEAMLLVASFWAENIVTAHQQTNMIDSPLGPNVDEPHTRRNIRSAMMIRPSKQKVALASNIKMMDRNTIAKMIAYDLQQEARKI